MRRFDQIFLFFVIFNVAVLWANFTGVFPEKWCPLIQEIEQIKRTFNESLSNYFEMNLLTQLGGLAYLSLQGILLVIKIFLGAPYYVATTLKNIIHPYDAQFGIFVDGLMLINYFVFIMWMIDVIRGGRVSGY